MTRRIWPYSIGLITIFCCGCERSDVLSANPNAAGTAFLKDVLIGDNARAICVTNTIQESCTSEQSEIYIDDVARLNDVRSAWINDTLVTVDVISGAVRKAADRSNDGRIAIRLNLNSLAPGIIIDHPAGKKVVRLPTQ
jgi:hypothetical protein